MVSNKKKTGAPSTYTPAKAEVICARLAAGESLTDICRDMHLDWVTVHRWMDAHEAFRNGYARARELQADTLADAIMQCACEPPERDEQGRVDGSEVQHRRLKIDALKWRAGKLRPKVYGDKILQEHTGGDGQPLILKIVTGVPTAPPALTHEDAPLLEAPDAPDEDIPA